MADDERIAVYLVEVRERVALVNSPAVEPIPVPGDDAGNARLQLWLEDAPRLLAAVEAVLALADKWDKRAAELDGMADRADARGADPLRTMLISTRAQAHNDCATELREALSRALLSPRVRRFAITGVRDAER